MSDLNSHQHHCVEISMEVHKVVLPPHRSTLEKLKTRLKETFFPDDPLRQFQGQTTKTKWILGAQYVFPILQWGPNYSFQLLKSDVVSGLTIASLAIPQVSLSLTNKHNFKAQFGTQLRLKSFDSCGPCASNGSERNCI